MVKSLTLFKMELLTSLRYKVNFFGTLLSVLLCMLPALVMLIDRDISIFGFENAMQYSGYLIIANAYWCMAESFWDFTFVMRNKMREGILEETLMLPLNTVQFILGWACNSIFITIIQTLPLFILSFLLLGLQNIKAVFIIFFVEIVSAAASFSIAYMLIALMLYWNEADQIVSMIANIAPLLCGVLIPLKELPLLLRGISVFFPFSWALDIIRFYYCQMETLLPIKIEWCVFFFILAAYFIAGLAVYGRLFEQSRKENTYSGY